MAQPIERPSTVRETRVRALGWEDPLEKEMATHSRTTAWKIPWTEATDHGVAESDTTERLYFTSKTSTPSPLQIPRIHQGWTLASGTQNRLFKSRSQKCSVIRDGSDATLVPRTLLQKIGTVRRIGKCLRIERNRWVERNPLLVKGRWVERNSPCQR